MNAKTIISFVFIAFFSFVAIAQGRISFAYDENGNRVRRELVITSPLNAPARQGNNEKSYYDTIGDRAVKISQDVSGHIKIAISNLQNGDSGFIDIHTLKGFQIFYQEISYDIVEVDISTQPDGIYILRVYINDKQTSWKIIKR